MGLFGKGKSKMNKFEKRQKKLKERIDKRALLNAEQEKELEKFRSFYLKTRIIPPFSHSWQFEELLNIWEGN